MLLGCCKMNYRLLPPWFCSKVRHPKRKASQKLRIDEARGKRREVIVQTLRVTLSCRFESSSIRGNLCFSNITSSCTQSLCWHFTFFPRCLFSSPGVIKDFSIILKLILYHMMAHKRVFHWNTLKHPTSIVSYRFKWQYFWCRECLQSAPHSSSGL